MDCLPSLELKLHRGSDVVVLFAMTSWRPQAAVLKVWSMDPLEGSCKVKSLFIIIVRLPLLFHRVDFCPDGTKAMVGKTVGPLAWSQGRGTSCTSSHYILLHLHVLTGKRKPVSLRSHLRMSSKKQSKLFILFSHFPWVRDFSGFCMIKWEVHIKHWLYTEVRTLVIFRKNSLLIELWAGVKCFFHGHNFQ